MYALVCRKKYINNSTEQHPDWRNLCTVQVTARNTRTLFLVIRISVSFIIENGACHTTLISIEDTNMDVKTKIAAEMAMTFWILGLFEHRTPYASSDSPERCGPHRTKK
jgi:hypothetical protein